MIAESELIELAPVDLRNFRVKRYLGDDLNLSLSAFAPPDQERLRELYDYLQALLVALNPEKGMAADQLAEFLEENTYEHILGVVRGFGEKSYAACRTPLMAKTIHDLRGGGLAPLLAQLDLTLLLGIEKAAFNALYFLTRDHLKIMRNALTGLDDAKRDLDLLPKIHSTDFIVQKWQGATLHGHAREIRLEIDCEEPIAISECCVEFGGLDRILYNLINNACRHSAGEVLKLALFPIPDPAGENIRFVLINTVSPENQAQLRHTRLPDLFKVGSSTTGSGYGLAIATDFVMHAYGLKSEDEAIKGGYLGAALLEEGFAAWFHWPRVVED